MSTAGVAEARKLHTVRVPADMVDAFASAEAVVARYFAERAFSPERGTIEISGERYVLVRAASLSVELFGVVRKLYGPGQERAADAFALNILFDLAYAIGRSDAKDFHARMGLEDPIARLSAGPVHFAHSGWAFVDIHPESTPRPDEDFLLVYDHPYSFEASTWLAAGATPSSPACVMNAGYSSGWCGESFGLDLVASEILCRARGDEACRFVMAPPSRIEAVVERHRAKLVPPAARTRQDPIPDLFARKRMEDELRRANEELDERVRRRTAELEAANARLAQAQKLEAVGRLAGGIAHDFNNLLAVVLMRSSMVQSRVAKDDPLWEDMEAIRVACRQGASLTRHMIAFSRGQAADVRVVDLDDLVRSFVEDVQPLVGEDVSIAVELTGEPTPVLADRAQLEQVLINLVVNARDAMRSGGQLTVTAGRIDAKGLAVTTAALRDGSYAVLAVRDTGAGMDEETTSRIFDPFFSTKDPGRGTGLGLSTVYRIVHDAGGAIGVASEPGKGTTFTLYLPLSGEPLAHAPAPTAETDVAAPASPSAPVRILVVEDKPELRAAIVDALVAAGQSVVGAGGPLQALALVEEDGIDVDVLLTDLSMPELGGREVAERIRAARPDVLVLFMSGYDRDGENEAAKPPSDRLHAGVVLHKPFAVEDLVRWIHEKVRAARARPRATTA